MLADVVSLLALLALLAVGYLHPRARVELVAAVVAAAATLATGVLGSSELRTQLRHLAPVVCFLAAILVVSESCRRSGLFAAVGARLARAGSRERLYTLTFLVATAVTVVLSLDATVVLLTPVVLAATRSRFVVAELTCVRLANSASLLLPVSNLTNLLALPALGLTFGRFTELMAPSWVVVLLVEHVVLRVQVRATHEDDDNDDEPPTTRELPPLPRIPLVVVALMLVGFAVTSPLHLAPAWVAGVAAIVLAGRDLARRTTTWRDVVDDAHPSFAIYVLALGVVVAALGKGWFGDRLAQLVPHHADLVGLLAVAALGAVLANLVNNLPAVLLLVPLVAPLGTTALLAMLIGVNVGSSLTWTGSLANLLWRRVLVRAQHAVPTRAFTLSALVAVPVAITGGVLALDAWSTLIG